MKISFIALEKGMTVLELFLITIQTSHRMFEKEGLIHFNQQQKRKNNKIFEAIVSNDKGLL